MKLLIVIALIALNTSAALAQNVGRYAELNFAKIRCAWSTTPYQLKKDGYPEEDYAHRKETSFSGSLKLLITAHQTSCTFDRAYIWSPYPRVEFTSGYMFPNTMSGMKLVPGTQRGLYEAIGISWSRTGNQAPKWTISCSEYGENHVLRSLSCESPTDLAYLEGQVRAVRTPMNQSTGKIKVQVGPLGGSPR